MTDSVTLCFFYREMQICFYPIDSVLGITAKRIDTDFQSSSCIVWYTYYSLFSPFVSKNDFLTITFLLRPFLVRHQ